MPLLVISISLLGILSTLNFSSWRSCDSKLELRALLLSTWKILSFTLVPVITIPWYCLCSSVRGRGKRRKEHHVKCNCTKIPKVWSRELSKVGELVSINVCMEIMDLLYETEETSMLFNSPHSLAASILVVAYTLSVPKQQREFPLLPWVKFVTSYEEEYILEIVLIILEHILKLEAKDQKFNRSYEA